MSFDDLNCGSATSSHAESNMTLIGFDDPGLLVLPYHRLLGGLSPDKYAEVKQSLSRIFESTPMLDGRPLDAELVAQAVAERGQNSHGSV